MSKDLNFLAKKLCSAKIYLKQVKDNYSKAFAKPSKNLKWSFSLNTT